MYLKGIIKHISTTAQFMLEANVVLPYLITQVCVLCCNSGSLPLW